MASANATFCDFLVRGVNLDAKDILTAKSDPYIVIKIPVRDPRTLAPPVVPVDNKRYSDPTNNYNNNITNYNNKNNESSLSLAARDNIENELTNVVKENVVTYVNSQGTIQTITGQMGPTAGTIIQETTTTVVAGSALPVTGVVAVAMLGSALYHYARKTHPPTPGYVQIYESDVAGNTLNPHWQPFRLGLYELCRGNLDLEVLIECYDWDRFKPSDFIGGILMPVRTLLNARDEIKIQLLNHRNITSGLLFIQCRPSVPQISYCDLHASAYNLAKKDLFGLSDPYFVIKVPQNIAEHPSLYNNAFAGNITIPSTTVACGIQNHKIMKGYGEVFESFVIRKNLNPDWGNFRIGFYELCRGEVDVNILIQCYDYNRILPSKFIGSAQVSVRSLIESKDAIALPLVSKKGKMAGTFYLQCTPSSPLPKQTIPQQIKQQQIQLQNIHQNIPTTTELNQQKFLRRHPPLRYTRTLPQVSIALKESYESPVLPAYSSPEMETQYYYESASYEYLAEEVYVDEEVPESYDPQSYADGEAAESYDPQSYTEDPQSYSEDPESYSRSYPLHPSCAYTSSPLPDAAEGYSEELESCTSSTSYPEPEEQYEVPEIKVQPPPVARRRPIARVPSYPPPVCPPSPEIRTVSSPILSTSALPFQAPPRRKPPPPPKPSTTTAAPSSNSSTSGMIKSTSTPTVPSSTSSSMTKCSSFPHSIPAKPTKPTKPTTQSTQTTTTTQLTQMTTVPKRAPPPPPRSLTNTSSSSSSSSTPSSITTPSVPPSSAPSSISTPPSKPAPPRPQRAKPPLGFSYLNPPSSISNNSNSSVQRPSMKMVSSCPQIERRPPNPNPAHYYVPPSVVS